MSCSVGSVLVSRPATVGMRKEARGWFSDAWCVIGSHGLGLKLLAGWIRRKTLKCASRLLNMGDQQSVFVFCRHVGLFINGDGRVAKLSFWQDRWLLCVGVVL